MTASAAAGTRNEMGVELGECRGGHRLELHRLAEDLELCTPGSRRERDKRAAGVWGPKDKDEEDKNASPPSI